MSTLKGIHYLTDSHNKKVAVQIDIATLEKNEERLHDLFDILIAEARESEDEIPFETILKKHKVKLKK